MRKLIGFLAALMAIGCSNGTTSYGGREVVLAPKPQATPTPLPLEPNFESIRANIFEPKCLGCHSEGGRAEHIPLGTLDDILNSPRELVIPGNPDESGITLAIERQDEKRMPPPPRRGPLSSEEVAAIRKWIETNL